MIETFLAIGDCWVVFVTLSLIGRKWAKVHHFSLIVLIVVRAAFTVVQIQLLMRSVAPFDDKFDFYSF